MGTRYKLWIIRDSAERNFDRAIPSSRQEGTQSLLGLEGLRRPRRSKPIVIECAMQLLRYEEPGYVLYYVIETLVRESVVEEERTGARAEGQMTLFWCDNDDIRLMKCNGRPLTAGYFTHVL